MGQEAMGDDGATHDLSVVVPVHDAADTLESLTASFLESGLHVQVVLVDDHSTDDSPAIVRRLAASEDVVGLHHDHNRGAGVARNTGFAAATGRHTLFFDADDVVHPAALRRAVAALDETGADLLMASYEYRRGDQPSRTGMNAYDEETWARYLGSADRRLGTLDDLPRLLGCSNYPWNKVLRTRTYRRAGLVFGDTQVHNDILGHWYALLFARSILLVDDDLCTHVVAASGGHLTNEASEARLALLDALDATYDLLAADPDRRRRHAAEYWSFVLRVTDWASGRLDPRHRERFAARLREHLLRIDLADFARIRLDHDPSLADAIVDHTLS